ncbi:hypothetical protein HQ535_14070 [bacterium]|nr:hypothetical protein [bacterium]
MADGIQVQLLTADTSGTEPHLGMAQGYRLVVRSADVEWVQAIISRKPRPRK